MRTRGCAAPRGRVRDFSGRFAWDPNVAGDGGPQFTSHVSLSVAFHITLSSIASACC